MPILFKQVGTLAFTGDAGGTSRQVGHVSPAGVVAAGMLAQAVISGGGIHKKSVNSLDVVPATEALALPINLETTTRSPRRYNKRG